MIYDAVIAGGGPSGSTCALVMARLGLHVLLLERARHPRFHIGESLLPRAHTLFRELDLIDRLTTLPHTVKNGAEFGFAHQDDTRTFRFDAAFAMPDRIALNVERGPFDAMLLEEAVRHGAEVLEGEGVRAVHRLDDGDVRLESEARTVEARYLIDASGQASVVGRLLGTRQVLPHLRKVAYFSHCRNVERKDGEDGGNPIGIMCKEGWFWLIPIDDERTSIGLVVDEGLARRAGVPPSRMLSWAIARCPQMSRRCSRAEVPAENHIGAEFSYCCKPYAGPGHFLVGDSATFVDPIFSTGVCLGMMAARRAAEGVHAILRDGADPRRVQRQYHRYVDRSSSTLFRLVHAFYDHSFRELFLQAPDVLGIRRAIVTILSGQVFLPDPSWKLRWRLRLLEAAIPLNRFLPIVPRLQTFSLLERQPVWE